MMDILLQEHGMPDKIDYADFQRVDSVAQVSMQMKDHRLANAVSEQNNRRPSVLTPQWYGTEGLPLFL